jgi:heme/copper-type cytochrome/quinol oxidase subunit 3
VNIALKGDLRREFNLPDKTLIIVFGTLSTIALIVAGVCMYFAVKSAKKPEGELRMALWSFGALAGLVFSGMCFAYFLIPIIINHIFR